MSKKELEGGQFVCHTSCIGAETEGKKDCSSSDAMAVYECEDDEGLVYNSTCFSCGQSFNEAQFASSGVGAAFLGGEDVKSDSPSKRLGKPKKEPMTRKEVMELIKDTGYVAHGYRGLKDEYNKFYGHLTKLDGLGKPIIRYYPETVDSKVTGYKIRVVPKDFRRGGIGQTGIGSDLSGQIKFNSGGKYLLICGGEEDKVAAYQMLRESQIARNQEDFAPIAVVSPTTGEGSAHKQVAANYDWIDTFDIIIVGLDNDDAGHEATEKMIKVLPKDKVRVATWTQKDPNAALIAGKERQWLRDFYGAKELVASGIKSSVGMMDSVKEVLLSTKITLPPYMRIMEENMRRAFSTSGKIVNIIGSTSCGKSTHVNNMGYHWMFQESLKPLVISLEKTEGEYAMDMLSIHLEKNLGWFKEGQDAIDYLEKPEVQDLIAELEKDEYGQERWRIVDERDGSIQTIEKQIERGVKQYGCNIVIIDVLTDALRFLPIDQQEKHLQWQKMFVKQGVSIVNVLHTTKPRRDKDGKMIKTTEYDALGTGSFVQSAHINIVINRDKMATTALEKNTTEADMPKCREGTTGPAGKWVYDPETRKLYDSVSYSKETTIKPLSGEVDF